MNWNPMDPLDDTTKNKLVKSLEQGDLGEIINTYVKRPEVRELKIRATGDTALHVAVSDGFERYAERMIKCADNDVLKVGNNRGDTALHLAAKFGNAYLCKLIAKKEVSLIGKPNEDGETPFFSAVSHGKDKVFLFLHHFCKDKGEERCQDVSKKIKKCQEYCSYTTKNGETILHSAISGKHFSLAYIIIQMYPKLVNVKNKDGLSPLHLLATKPSVFPSGVQLFGIYKLFYLWVPVQKLVDIPNNGYEAPDPQPQPVWKDAHMKLKRFQYKFTLQNTEDKATNTQVYMDQSENLQDEEAANEQGSWEIDQQDVEAANEQVGYGAVIDQQDEAANVQVDHKENLQEDETATNGQVDHKENLQEDETATNEQDFKKLEWILLIMLLPLLLSILAVYYALLVLTWFPFKLVGYEEFARARRIKKRSIWSGQVMNKLIQIYYNEPATEQGGTQGPLPKEESICVTNIKVEGPLPKEESICVTENNKVEKVETPILIAAKHGISEMVFCILGIHLEAIHDVNAENKNIVMLAVEHRHPRLYNDLKTCLDFKKSVFGKVDKYGNSLLHIAANLKAGKQFWRIRGAALHMQMEIRWYKFIKKSMPHHFFVRKNKENKTAKEIFQETHQNLIEEGQKWLTSTSQSCSVVAALIATVAFAISTTVPGGLKQDNGVPTLEHKPVFILSATSSLIALTSSLISVVMFLGILNSNFKQKDFRKDLPRKLLLGLIFLLISIVSMFISFCAGHYFVLNQELGQYTTLVYMLLGVPSIVFIIQKFPLDFQVIWSTLSKKPRK